MKVLPPKILSVERTASSPTHMTRVVRRWPVSSVRAMHRRKTISKAHTHLQVATPDTNHYRKKSASKP